MRLGSAWLLGVYKRTRFILMPQNCRVHRRCHRTARVAPHHVFECVSSAVYRASLLNGCCRICSPRALAAYKSKALSDVVCVLVCWAMALDETAIANGVTPPDTGNLSGMNVNGCV